MKIQELQNGFNFSGKLLVKSTTIRTTAGGKPYLMGTYSDGTDTIGGTMWNYNSDKVFFDGDVVWIEGQVSTYAGKLQLNISSIMPSAAKPGEFLPQGNVDVDMCWDALMTMCDTIDNYVLKAIVDYIYSENSEALMVAPAAISMHHAYVGGLLQHTHEVAKAAAMLSYDGFDNIITDLSIAGAMLHDIGKIYVYDCSGASIAYTLTGTQQEHIIVGLSIIDEAVRALELGEEAKDLIDILKHIVASHHGTLEYGSPVIPACIPAYIVSIADGYSATMRYLLDAKVGPDGLTEKIYALGNKPKMSQSLINLAAVRSVRNKVICAKCGNNWYQSTDDAQRCTQCGEINGMIPQE